MSIWRNNPLTLVQYVTPFFTSLKSGFIFSLNQIAIIIISIQHCMYRRISPLMKILSILTVHMMILVIVRNPMYPILKQPVNNALYAISRSIFFKNPADNLCSFRFHNQLTNSIYLFHTISIWSCRSHILTIFLCNTFRCPFFCGNVFRISIIHQILDIHG